METTVTGAAMATSIAAAIAARDLEALRAILADDAHLRALLPGGLSERSGVAEIEAEIQTWFDGLEGVSVLEASAEELPRRLWVSYTLELAKGDDRWLMAQSAFCKVRDGRVTAIDLVCSGYRPV